jgi:hypothetical protein
MRTVTKVGFSPPAYVQARTNDERTEIGSGPLENNRGGVNGQDGSVVPVVPRFH